MDVQSQKQATRKNSILIKRVGYGQVKHREGHFWLVLGLYSSLENIIKAKNMTP